MDWETLESECMACVKCELHSTRNSVVFGEGKRDAEILFVGEGPGETEDRTGRPFVGRAGRLLDDMLACIGLEREMVYIANIVKCRPPNNRDPSLFEQELCMPWLRAQTTLIAPKIIVCLGRVPAQRIIRPDFRVSEEHGQVIQKGRFQMMAVFHPSYLLRYPDKRPETFRDLKVLESLISNV